MPIGAVLTTIRSENPSSYLHYGTWERFAHGRVLVGVDEAQAEFDTVQKEGGSKAHTLTTDQLPAHNHGNMTLTGSIDIDAQTDYACRVRNWTGILNRRSTKNASYFERTGDYTTDAGLTINASHAHDTVGSGQAHNNLQPYKTVYMWLRTA